MLSLVKMISFFYLGFPDHFKEETAVSIIVVKCRVHI